MLLLLTSPTVGHESDLEKKTVKRYKAIDRPVRGGRGRRLRYRRFALSGNSGAVR